MNPESLVDKTTSFLRLVEQTLQCKSKLEENQMKNISDLPENCIFNIIIRLPLESIQTSRFVSKFWYGIVNSPHFINAHLQRADIGLIFLTQATNPNKIRFSVECNVSGFHRMPVRSWSLFEPPLLFSIKFMEIKDGKGRVKEYNTGCTGKIHATCNGLIILEKIMKRRGLILLNPVTREMKIFPLGTISSTNCESYGFAFCHESGRYKLVHLFQDNFKYICCEIMDINGSESNWRELNGPPNGFFGWLGCQPVSAIGALHWVPHADRNNKYIVSMLLHDERFEKIPLPCTGGEYDGILEMGGFLGFVSSQDVNRIDVWMLRSLGGGSWEKQFSISVDGKINMVPLYSAGVYGEIVFKCKDSVKLYAYDHQLRVVRRIEVKDFSSVGCCLPHVNSLISWRI